MTTDLRTDLEALRDEWLKYKPYRHSAHRLTALLAKHVKAPAGPDLLEAATDTLAILEVGFGSGLHHMATLEGRAAWLDRMMPVRERLRSALTGHYAPSTPDLRAMVLAQYVEISTDAKKKVDPDGAQFLDGQWYIPRWGCDTLEHVLDAIAAEPAAPKEWRGPVECTDCGAQWDSDPVMHMKNGEICHGTLVPFERRKGGGW